MADDFSDGELGQRFKDLWTRGLSNKNGVDISLIYRKLTILYSDPWRKYHSPKHVVHCLRELDKALEFNGQRDAVEMALWFHDAVYTPGASDNEQRSAKLFAEWAKGCLPPAFVDKVCELILLTTHKMPPQKEEDRYIVDIDLSSFGLPWEEFIQDSSNVREELSFLLDEEYYPSHSRFLKQLIDRPRIYHTDHFHGLYEDAARRNIAGLLNIFSRQGRLTA